MSLSNLDPGNHGLSFLYPVFGDKKTTVGSDQEGLISWRLGKLILGIRNPTDPTG